MHHFSRSQMIFLFSLSCAMLLPDSRVVCAASGANSLSNTERSTEQSVKIEESTQTESSSKTGKSSGTELSTGTESSFATEQTSNTESAGKSVNENTPSSAEPTVATEITSQEVIEESEAIQPSEGYQTISYLYQTEDTVDVKAGGNDSAMVIGSLKKGEMLTVTEISQDNYGKITFENGTGWIPLESCELFCTNVSATSDGESDSVPGKNEGCDVIPDDEQFKGIIKTSGKTVTTGYTSVDTLIIRSGPGKEYDDLGYIDPDNYFTVSETSDNWGKVNYGDTEGWVYLGYCTESTQQSIKINSENCGWEESEDGWQFKNKDDILFTSDTMYEAWNKIKNKESGSNYYAVVDCTSNETFIFIGEKGNWIPYRLFICSTGSPSTPTVKGSFTISDRGYSFSQENYTCYYYTRFEGNYLFHTIEYLSETSIELDARLGENISQGCVRLQLADAKWIYENLDPGTAVITYEE